MTDNEVCIGGNRYRILEGDSQDNASPMPSVISSDMSTTEQKLTRLVDISGGGDIGGGYRSIVIEIPAHEQSYEIGMGLYATQVNIRCDQGITLTLNSTRSDNIFIDSAEFPFSISNLSLNGAIHTVFITTGANPTTVKILAFGLVY